MKRKYYLILSIIVFTISMYMIPTFKNFLILLAGLAIGVAIGFIQAESK